MNFVFNEQKAAQVAKYLIHKRQGTMNFGVLLKVMYLADRKALLDTGYPITGDAMISMRNGTLLSRVYDRIKGNFAEPEWAGIQRQGVYDVVAEGEPRTDALSRYELAVLDDVFEQYGDKTFFELRGITHNLPEWENPGASAAPIEPEVILKAEGRTEAEILRMSEDASAAAFMRTLAG